MTRMGKIYRSLYGNANIKESKEDRRKKFYQYSCPDGSFIVGWNNSGSLTKEEIARKCSRKLPDYRVRVK
jgi:hypothetical protein